MQQAAEFFIFCMDVHRLKPLLKHRGADLGIGPLIALIYGTIDCCLSSSNMAIAAETIGYVICNIDAVQRAFDELIDELKLPEGVLPVLEMCLGYPDEDEYLRPRLSTDIIFHDNVNRELPEEDFGRCFEAVEAMTAFSGWFEYLDRFFTTGKEFSSRDDYWEKAMARQELPLYDQTTQ